MCKYDSKTRKMLAAAVSQTVQKGAPKPLFSRSPALPLRNMSAGEKSCYGYKRLIGSSMFLSCENFVSFAARTRKCSLGCVYGGSELWLLQKLQQEH